MGLVHLEAIFVCIQFHPPASIESQDGRSVRETADCSVTLTSVLTSVDPTGACCVTSC